jgi:hypothetical protein
VALISKRLLSADSMLFAEETFENTFDFAHNLVRMKEPQEFARIQTEFVSRQAQVLAGSGQRILQDVNDVAKTPLEGSGRVIPTQPNGERAHSERRASFGSRNGRHARRRSGSILEATIKSTH